MCLLHFAIKLWGPCLNPYTLFVMNLAVKFSNGSQHYTEISLMTLS